MNHDPENHLILLEDLFGLNPKQLDIKTMEKIDRFPLLLITGRRTSEEEGEGP